MPGSCDAIEKSLDISPLVMGDSVSCRGIDAG